MNYGIYWDNQGILGKTKRLKYRVVSPPCVANKTILLVCIVATALVAVGCMHASNRTDAPRNVTQLDGFCASVITIGPDGHYLLKWRMVTRENAEHVNRCIERLGIPNVRVVQPLAGNQWHENQT